MKVKKLLIAFLLIGSVFLTSCMPMVYNYYNPKAEGGILKKSMCNGEIGPKDMIEFSLDKVKISIKADEIDEGIKVAVRFIIPKGNEIQIQSSSIKVYVPSSGSVFEGSLAPPEYRIDKSWRPGDIIAGESTESRSLFGKIRTGNMRFLLDAIVKIPKSELIKLDLPAFYVNNKQVNLPEIIFKKVNRPGMFPLNC